MSSDVIARLKQMAASRGRVWIVGGASYDDLLDVFVKVERMTEAKIEQSYRVMRDEQRIVSGAVKLAVIDRQGRLHRMPTSLRNPQQA